METSSNDEKLNNTRTKWKHVKYNKYKQKYTGKSAKYFT